MAAELSRAIEAILMVSDSPVETSFLAELLEIPPAQVDELCAELETQYRNEDRGFMLARVAGGFRYQSHPDLAPYLERYALEGQNPRLSAPAMETLAIVAYKQPVSRAQIAAIRGVNADGVLRTLTQRGYVTEVGRDPGPGQAVLYGTTPLLLERLGLDELGDLPPLADFVPGPEIMEALEHGLLAERRAQPPDEPAVPDASLPDEPATDAPLPDEPATDAPLPDEPAPAADTQPSLADPTSALAATPEPEPERAATPEPEPAPTPEPPAQ